MSADRGAEAIHRFHEGSKHPRGALLDPTHRYDPYHRPPRVKEYAGGTPVDLPPAEPEAEPATLDVLRPNPVEREPRGWDLASLGRFFHFSAGVTKHLTLGALGRVPFRAASCTGALYHIELYAAWGGSQDLPAGLYAYRPERHDLLALRIGDPRSRLAELTGENEAVQRSPLTVIFTSAYWRNAAKYQARAYRHAFWDSGTILANSLALAAAYGWRARVTFGFVDDALEALLGISDEPEVPLFLLSLGESESTPGGQALGELEAKPAPITGHRIHWPAIARAHRATALEDPEELVRWRQSDFEPAKEELDGVQVAGPEPLNVSRGSGPGIEEVIQLRGSTRRFSRAAVSEADFWAIVNRVHGRFATDLEVHPIPDVYALVNAVEGLAAGSYLLRPESREGVRLREGGHRREAGHLALNQALGADAAFNLYWLAELEPMLEGLGARGYRIAQLQAAVAAGRGYLAAYALGQGATGLTFFDDAVAQFFEADDPIRAVLFLLAVGQPD